MGYLFVAPAVFLPRLREELQLGYGLTAAHVAATAAGSMIASALLPRLERRFTRRTLIWCGVAGTAVGELILTAAHRPALSISAMAIIGVSFAPVVSLTQAVLADLHGDNRAVALTETNTLAACGGVLAPLVIGGAALIPAVGWRGGLAACAVLGLMLPVIFRRRAFVDGGTLGAGRAAGLPRAVRVRGGLLFAVIVVEICVTFLGPTYLRDAIGFSQSATAALSALFLIAVVAGRATGSVLSRRMPPTQLLTVALVVTSAGFGLLWATTSRLPAAIGYAVVGAGVGNFFPLAVSLVVAKAPGQSGQAISTCLVISSFAALCGPLVLGAVADQTTIRAAFAVVPFALFAALLMLGVVVSRRLSLSESYRAQ